MSDGDDHLRSHIRRAQTLVARRLADARSHAAAGSALAASSRINELGEGLVFALANVRSQFDRRAFHHHRDLAIHDTEACPSQEGEQFARTAAIAGRDQYRDEAGPLAEAIAHLHTARAAAVDDRTSHQLRAAMLAGWGCRHRPQITRHVQTALPDAQMAIHHALGEALVRKELR